jgi:hypothetical protein
VIVRPRALFEVAILSALVTLGATATARAETAGSQLAAGAGRQSVKRFALVVGSNRPVKPGLGTLRYADDDAVRWTILFRTFGAEVELLTDLDGESVRLYGVDAPDRRSATHGEVARAMALLRGEIERAHAAGARTAFYFVYAGHGDEEDGEGYVGLADGKLLRKEIEEKILARSGADTNHVIIDACRSYFIAYDRGPGGSRRPWLEPYFNAGTGARFRNTGFVLASSSGGATHEWEEFQAGIFSHEVRSGLFGGADSNGDGRITYTELAAFVRVANQPVRNDRYRPEILARAPSNGDDVLLDLGDAVGGRVRFGSGLAGRHVLEDGLGVRWADVHPGPRQNLTLALPTEPWGGHVLFVESLADNTEYRFNGGTDVALADLKPQRRGLLSRGALHEAFALLFAMPFDVTALTSLSSLEAELTVGTAGEVRLDRPFWTHRTRRISAASAGIGSAAAFAAAAALAWSAAGLRNEAQNENGQNRAALGDEIERRNQWTVGAVTGGAVLAVTAAALLIWDRRSRE